MSETWRTCVLGDLVKIKHGFAFPGSGILSEKTENLLLTPGNFEIGGGFKSGKNKFFNGEVDPEYILPTGEVIVTMTDLSKQADTLGYSAKVPSSTIFRCLHNQRIGRVVPRDNSFSLEFVYWLMRSKDYRHWIVSRATGSTVKHTSPSRIEDFEFDLPPLAIQKGIAHILGTLDSKIELNRKTNETLESMAKTLFKSWFVNFDPVRAKAEGRSTGLPDEISELFPDSFEQSELTEIPSGWRSIPLKEIIDISHGFAFPGSGISGEKSINYLVTPGNFAIGGGFKFGKGKYFSGEVDPQFIFSPGELIVTMTDLSKRADTLGYSARVPIGSACRFLHNQRIGRVSLLDGFQGLEFVYWLMRSSNYRHWIVSTSTGSTVKHSSPTRIRDFEFPLPPGKLTALFEAMGKSLLDKIQSNEVQNSLLEQIRNSLLPRLISGELRVPDAEKMIEEVGV